jgi:RimJ/RimL family protein N-acetyltransferase
MEGDFPTLTTERLVLREIAESDAEALFPILSDPIAMRYWATVPHKSIEETTHLLREVRGAFRAGTGCEWMITLRGGDDQAIGKVCHHHWLQNHRRSQLGYILRRDLWKRGLMHEALRAVIDYGFGKMNLHSIEAQLDPRNAGSARTLELLGFVREGHLKESFILDGELCDTWIYSLLEPRR